MSKRLWKCLDCLWQTTQVWPFKYLVLYQKDDWSRSVDPILGRLRKFLLRRVVELKQCQVYPVYNVPSDFFLWMYRSNTYFVPHAYILAMSIPSNKRLNISTESLVLTCTLLHIKKHKNMGALLNMKNKYNLKIVKLVNFLILWRTI